MAIYFLYVVLISLEFWYASKKGWLESAKGKGWYVAICCAEMALMAALRSNTVGADTARYVEALEYYSKLPKDKVLFADLVWPFDFEKGYLLLTQICALINMPAPVFLLLVALVIYIPLFYAINRYSKIPYISILAFMALGFFSYSLGIFRQMMAMSIVLCGVKFIEQKEWAKYFALVVIAFTIHTTAIIMVPVYILAQIPVKKYWKWIVPVELACLSFGRTMIELAAKVLPQYAHYFGGKYDVQGGTYLMLILLNVLLFAMLYLNWKGLSKNYVVISALSLAVIVQTMGYSMAIFGRIVTYFSIFSIFAFSEIASVLLTEPSVYKKDLQEQIVAKNWKVVRVGKLAFNLKTVLWMAFIGGLMLLVLKDLIGNRYITPYTFFFMK